MKYKLNFKKRALDGIEKIRKCGDKGKIKQLEKSLNNLSQNPEYPALRTHKLKDSKYFNNRTDVFVSYVRTGPGGERLVWAYGEKSKEIQIIDVEYVGVHVDK